MVSGLPGQQTLRIQNLFYGVLAAIRCQHGIAAPSWSPYIVPANASFADVVQNTDWYCWRGDSQPPYRYRRYLEVLQRIKLPDGDYDYPVAHVDIGCGAGLFSWAFLDWAKDNNIGYDRVALHGYDHSSEMINLSHQMRAGLMQSIPNYPDLHYTDCVASLLTELTRQHRDRTIYIVTFGHVLVQAQSANDISSFANIIAHILSLGVPCPCVLAAVDAKGRRGAFASGWNTLLTSLTAAEIQHRLFSVGRTAINDDNRAKVAVLFQADQEGR